MVGPFCAPVFGLESISALLCVIGGLCPLTAMQRDQLFN